MTDSTLLRNIGTAFAYTLIGYKSLQTGLKKIDVDKNSQLAEALRVKTLPTLMIYKSGEMKWRQSGEQDAATLVGILKEYV